MNTEVAETLRLGREHIGAGRYTEAAELISSAIRLASPSAELHAMLGSALMGLGRHADAERSFNEAIRLRPAYVEALNDLGNALRLQGKTARAIASYREALRLRADVGQIHQNLGTALAEEGMLADAEACLRESTRLQPARAEAFCDLALVKLKRNEAEQAAQIFKQALQVNPGLVAARVGLARCNAELGNLADAVTLCGEALRLDPKSHEALIALGAALQAQGKLDEAATRYRAALEFKPESADATYGLAALCMVQGRHDEAAAGFKATLRLQPSHVLAMNNLGNVFLALAKPKEAIGCFEAAQRIQPQFAGAYSNVLFALNFVTDVSAQDVSDAHRRWGEAHAQPLAGTRRFAGRADPNKRLRIGYVSGDFRAHSVSLFIEPVLECHDRSNVEVFCYSDVVARDEVTARLEHLADRWVSLAGRSNDEMAARVREDGIDILVDLAGHTGANRLLAFARGPAPIQMTWLGYPNTSGMKAMDYRLTDAYTDPPGMTEHLYTETLVRMPDSLWCYRPDGNAADVNALPALNNGHVTFGSFNNFAKVTPWTRALWARLLATIPDSRLLIVGTPHGRVRAEITAEFSMHGINPSRLEFAPRLSRQDFFKHHHLVDIALDPYPFQGGTTTCETLWMGVPVISLAGKMFAARAGVSLLSNVGLPGLTAIDPDDYVAKATQLAGDKKSLASLRQELRQRMARSPLTNGPRFASNLEEKFRWMWHRWCEGVVGHEA
jgi:protein O-GlcNAc transferase